MSRKEIRVDVWKKYIRGQQCPKETEELRDISKSLSMELESKGRSHQYN